MIFNIIETFYMSLFITFTSYSKENVLKDIIKLYQQKNQIHPNIKLVRRRGTAVSQRSSRIIYSTV